ncbi:alpha/beta hydrolase [Alteromonas sp. a30]|uniref:alpha/beta hydrolase n=1 Tax=Alteromonas sp. a30 TaxID=2730917 RepID=UPI002280CE13|nr:alpha/beta fold hydrolase [Alteromonas sp. a30]MCY7296254.1 alpha/beta fold hydrolase [Alteromonas sp. a30]
MSAELLPFVEVNPQTQHDAVVIWLHGLGDSGNGFAPIVPQLNLPADHKIRFVFPHAPIRPVTINNGFQMRAWYDIKSMNFEDRADKAGVQESTAMVEALIESEMAKGVPAERVILAGFSQGGVIAYYLGARLQKKIAGMICLSTYMSDNPSTFSEWSDTNKNTPIFAAHGQFDDVVPIQLGKNAYTNMKDNGFAISWKEYPMQHNVCLEQLHDISRWLQERLA